jgi:hypothetical protein
MHSLAWVGAIHLTDKQVQKIKSDFKCWLCRCNSHPWPTCPYLSKWEIKKKPETRTTRNGRGSPSGDANPTGSAAAVSDGRSDGVVPVVDLLGTANSVRFASEVELIPVSNVDNSGVENRFRALQVDESDDDTVVDDVIVEHTGSEVLSADLGVTVTRGTDSIYLTALSQCLGSARAVRSSMIPPDLDSLIPPTFSVVADSGATNPMVPWKELFISYMKCAKASYVLLANNARAPCLGRGTIKIQLGGKTVIVTNALHVPTLRCPLYSIRCHSRIRGCAFHADNRGVLLAFPEFTLPVDISSDCLLQGAFPSSDSVVSFDERLVGTVSAVSDNTRFRHKRRGVASSPTLSANCQETIVDSPLGPATNSSSSVESELVMFSSPSVHQTEPMVVEDVTEDDSDDELDDEAISSISPDENDDSIADMIANNTNLQKLVEEMGLDPSIAHPTPSSRLSAVQIGEIAQACIKTLEKHGRITPALISFLSSNYDSSSRTPTSSTPPDRPDLLSSDKMPSSATAHRRFTIPEL